MRSKCILFALCFFAVSAGVAWGEVFPQIDRPAAAVAHPARAHRQVRMAALFGHAMSASTVRDNSVNHAEAFRFVEQMSGTAQAITVFVPVHSTAKSLAVGLYSDRGGDPGSLLSSNAMRVPATAGWVTVPIKNTPLQKSTAYWTAVLGKGGRLDTRDRESASCVGTVQAKPDLGALPQWWGQGARFTACIAAYVIGQPAAAGSGASSTPTTTTAAPAAPTTQLPSAGLTLPLPPINTSPPTISGTPQQGQTLTASNGSWANSPTSYAFQWQDCGMLLCTNIANATASTYALQASDVGSTIDVVVTASNAAGSFPAASSRTATVASQPAPANTALPTISGTAQQGDTLTASNGSWSNSPTSYTYQWQDCATASSCSNISGATSSSYTLQSTDVRKTIDVIVTATNAGGSTSATSAQTQTVSAAPPAKPVNTALPTISGTAQQGDTLTASNGSWSNSPTSYTYQWQDCTSASSCSNISGATSSSYTLQSTDVGKTIDVIVTATNAGGSTSATSAQTQTVSAAPPAKPVNTALPTISGTAQQGDTLTASNGSWSNSPTSYTYQWQDCATASSCSNISGATSSSYTLQSTDVGDTIDVIVTATNGGGSTSATSAQTGTVTAPTPAKPVNTAVPTISGTAQQGDTLTASNGSWSNSPTSYTYQWQDCTSASSCSNISGATSSSYTLQSTDVGDTIDVIVTATNGGGSTSATSAQTGTVTAPTPAKPLNTAVPTISGTAQQGDTLTASNGSWSNSPTSYTYQWQDCTSASSCSNISGATSSTYTLQSTDVGDTIDVIVTATNAGGSTPATSAQTATVTASSGSGGSGLSPLHVVGNTLQNANGQQVVLHGTDVSGSSYACEQNGGYGFSDTPTGNSLYSAMVGNDGGSLSKNWNINSVTLGINQDCWLGINGVKAQYSGQNYINYVKSEVTSMESYGIYPVITFFVGEPGTDTPNWSSTGNGNAPMPNNDHVPLVWEEMANTFKSDPDVIFRLYEEPWPESTGTNLATWQCWSQGDVQYGTGSDSTLPGSWQSSPGTQTAPSSTSSTEHCNPLNKDAQGTAYSSVGMQSLVNIIRGTGANNVIQIPGVAFANMLSCTSTESPTSCGFLDSADGVRVTDPVSSNDPSLGAQLMADTDNYPDMGQDCGSLTCVTDTYGPVEQVMPIDMGEAGVENNSDAFPLIEQFIDQYDTWHQSYYGSQWESWADLITNYNGTPDSGWGTWYYDHITGAS